MAKKTAVACSRSRRAPGAVVGNVGSRKEAGKEEDN